MVMFVYLRVDTQPWPGKCLRSPVGRTPGLFTRRCVSTVALDQISYPRSCRIALAQRAACNTTLDANLAPKKMLPILKINFQSLAFFFGTSSSATVSGNATSDTANINDRQTNSTNIFLDTPFLVLDTSYE